MNPKWTEKILSLTIVLALAASARADLFGFDNITNNSPINAAIGEAQMFVEVTDAGAHQVLFTFTNTGPAASSITDIYFSDDAFLGTALVDNFDTDVSFPQLIEPDGLPGSYFVTPSFHISRYSTASLSPAGFSADSAPPVQLIGVNPGESVGITFYLKDGGEFADVISELLQAELRIGIRIQGFDSGDSESFVNNVPVPVPAPDAVLLGIIGLVLVGGVKRRWDKKIESRRRNKRHH